MSHLPTVPQWQKIATLKYSNFSAASLTNNVSTGYTLPAGSVIMGCLLNPTTTFSGGSISNYTISIGTVGNYSKYLSAQTVFTGATLTPATNTGIESMSVVTTIYATATSTSANLNAATQGSVDIYLLVAQV